MVSNGRIFAFRACPWYQMANLRLRAARGYQNAETSPWRHVGIKSPNLRIAGAGHGVTNRPIFDFSPGAPIRVENWQPGRPGGGYQLRKTSHRRQPRESAPRRAPWYQNGVSALDSQRATPLILRLSSFHRPRIQRPAAPRPQPTAPFRLLVHPEIAPPLRTLQDAFSRWSGGVADVERHCAKPPPPSASWLPATTGERRTATGARSATREGNERRISPVRYGVGPPSSLSRRNR